MPRVLGVNKFLIGPSSGWRIKVSVVKSFPSWLCFTMLIMILVRQRPIGTSLGQKKEKKGEPKKKTRI